MCREGLEAEVPEVLFNKTSPGEKQTNLPTEGERYVLFSRSEFCILFLPSTILSGYCTGSQFKFVRTKPTLKLFGISTDVNTKPI